MRKLMVTVAMLAMMLATASPAFAHAVAGDFEVDFVDSDQVAVAVAIQENEGDARFASAIAQDVEIDQSQVLAGLDSTAAGGSVFIN